MKRIVFFLVLALSLSSRGGRIDDLYKSAENIYVKAYDILEVIVDFYKKYSESAQELEKASVLTEYNPSDTYSDWESKCSSGTKEIKDLASDAEKNVDDLSAFYDIEIKIQKGYIELFDEYIIALKRKLTEVKSAYDIRINNTAADDGYATKEWCLKCLLPKGVPPDKNIEFVCDCVDKIDKQWDDTFHSTIWFENYSVDNFRELGALFSEWVDIAERKGWTTTLPNKPPLEKIPL